MKIFLFLLFSNLCLPATAQADSTITKLPEVAAEFPGGNQALLRWIRENIHEIDQAPDIDFPGRYISASWWKLTARYRKL